MPPGTADHRGAGVGAPGSRMDAAGSGEPGRRQPGVGAEPEAGRSHELGRSGGLRRVSSLGEFGAGVGISRTWTLAENGSFGRMRGVGMWRRCWGAPNTDALPKRDACGRSQGAGNGAGPEDGRASLRWPLHEDAERNRGARPCCTAPRRWASPDVAQRSARPASQLKRAARRSRQQFQQVISNPAGSFMYAPRVFRAHIGRPAKRLQN
jgi:hypothetical protein